MTERLDKPDVRQRVSERLNRGAGVVKVDGWVG